MATLTAPESFFHAYLVCALWSSNDESDENGGDPMDEHYGTDDFAPEALATMRADCDRFYAENAALMAETGATDDQHGHDFWLTRNHHGAGFWDRGYGDKGDALTEAANRFRSVDLYVGDDGSIYAM